MGSALEQYIKANPSPSKPAITPLEALISKKAETATDDSGFMSYLGNVTEKFIKAQYVKSQIQDPVKQLAGAIHPSFGYNPDPNTEEGKIKAQVESGQYTSFSDWMNAFGQLLEKTPTAIKAALDKTPTSPTDFAIKVGTTIANGINPATIGKGILQPAVDMAELDSGVSLTGKDIVALDPVEKATRVRDLVAFAAATAVGGGVSGIFDSAVESGLIGTAGSIATRVAKSATVGAFAGGTYAGVNQQPVDQVIASTLLGGGIGAIHGRLFGGATEIKGPDVAKVREMQPETNSIASQVGVINSALSSNDAAEVILKGKVGLQPNIPWKIPGIDLSKIGDTQGQVPEGFKSVLHVDKEGTGKLLVYNPKEFPGPDSPYALDESFYRRTGFIKDEQVRYLGKDNWSVQDSVGDEVTLRNESDGHTLDVPKSEVVDGIQGSLSHINDTIRDNLYEEWQSTLPEPKGYDEVDLNSPTHLAERIPELEGLELQKHLDGFLKSKGFADNQLSVIRRQIQGKLMSDALSTMHPDDKAFVDAHKADGQTKIETLDDISRHAGKFNYTIKDGESGRIHVLDDKGSLIHTAQTPRDAANFINKTGNPVGTILDQNPQLDTGSISSSPPLPPDGGVPKYPEDDFFDYHYGSIELNKMNWGESFQKDFPGFQNVAMFTKPKDYFANVDDHYGTSYSKNIYFEVVQKKNIANGMTHAPITELKRIQKGLAANTTAYRRIFNYLKTESPTDIAARLTDVEKETGRVLSTSGSDIENLFKYRTEVEKLQREYPDNKVKADPQLQNEYARKIQDLNSKYKLTERDQQVNSIINNVKALPNEQASFGKIAKYMRSLKDLDGSVALSKDEFAAKNKMPGKELVAAQQLKNQMSKLKNELGLTSDPYDILDHAKRYYDGNVSKALEDFVGQGESKNYSKLIKAGYLNAFDDNPFKVHARTITGVYDIKSGFQDATEAALKDIAGNKQALINQGVPGIADRSESVAKRFISEIRGQTLMPDKNLHDVTKRMLEDIKINGKSINSDGKLVDSWANAIGRAFNFKYLDGRMQLGISHFAVSTFFSLAGRGVEYTGRMLKNGAGADGAVLEDLQQRGVFRGIAPYSAFTPDADVTSYGSRVGQAVDIVEKAGFKSTLLPTVYDKTVAGHYLTTKGDVLSGLKDYADGKIDGAALKKKLFLSRYDVNVNKTFNHLAETGKPEDAAHYLGMQAVEDLVGTYARGNTPFGWGSVFGRLMGQYGQFSRFKWAATMRLITRGTMAERAQSGAILGASLYAAKKASDATGIDFMKLSPWYDMFWLKSVAFGTGEDVISAVSGNGLESTLAQHRLKKQFLGNTAFGFIPLPNVVQDVTNGISDIGEGNVETGTAELLGFRKQPKPR